jgi:hypothetical protein
VLKKKNGSACVCGAEDITRPTTNLKGEKIQTTEIKPQKKLSDHHKRTIPPLGGFLCFSVADAPVTHYL